MATMLPARQNNDPGLPVRIIVTAEPRHGKTVPPLEAADVTVKEGRDKRPVDGLTPLGPEATTQLMLLIDDSSRGTFDTEIPALKRFVNALPPQTSVAVAYMTSGMAQMAESFTNDHAAAASSIHLSLGVGGSDVSPYDSLTDAVKKWPTTPADRKEIIMISSGVENLGGGFDPENPYVNAGIDSAVKAGVIVYTIYNPSAGHEGHVFWRNTWGQSFLSELSDATGGEAYIIGFGSPVSFQPFLEEIMEAQRHQYVLTFLAKAENKSSFQQIKASVMEKDASLAAPTKVYVRAGL